MFSMSPSAPHVSTALSGHDVWVLSGGGGTAGRGLFSARESPHHIFPLSHSAFPPPLISLLKKQPEMRVRTQLPAELPAGSAEWPPHGAGPGWPEWPALCWFPSSSFWTCWMACVKLINLEFIWRRLGINLSL